MTFGGLPIRGVEWDGDRRSAKYIPIVLKLQLQRTEQGSLLQRRILRSGRLILFSKARLWSLRVRVSSRSGTWDKSQSQLYATTWTNNSKLFLDTKVSYFSLCLMHVGTSFTVRLSWSGIILCAYDAPSLAHKQFRRVLLYQPTSYSGSRSPYYQGAKKNPGLEPGEVVRQSRGGTHGRWNRIILLPCK